MTRAPFLRQGITVDVEKPRAPRNIMDPNGGDPTSPLSPSADPFSPGFSSVNSSIFFAEPSQTLIFLDWDDTLFPTSQIIDGWGVPSRVEEWESLTLTDEQELKLEHWREVLSEYLRICTELTQRCVVLTNAKPGWVESCLARFAPSLKTLFDSEDGLRVVYAREALRKKQRSRLSSPRGNPAKFSASVSEEDINAELTEAKFVAMRKEAKEFYSQYPNQSWKNIISVGDSRYERDAIQEVAIRRRSPEGECLRLKALHTPENPSIADLTYRLRLGCQFWPILVHLDKDLDVDMNTPEKLQVYADAIEMPEIRGLIRQTTPELDDEETAHDMDELYVAIQSKFMK